MSCETPPTQVLLVIETDIELTRNARIEIAAFEGALAVPDVLARAQQSNTRVTTITRSIDGEFRGFSGSVGVVRAAPSGATATTLWIRTTLEQSASAPEAVLVRVAQVPFVPMTLNTARVFLALRCTDASTECTMTTAEHCTISARCIEQGATCGDRAQCVSPEIPATPPSVRLVAPASLSSVTNRRPELRWEAPFGYNNVTVELCEDRACARLFETLRATQGTIRPTQPLAPSRVVFWRARAMSADGEQTAWSPTWLFHVPASDAAGVGIALRRHNDVNGDGFDDLLVHLSALAGHSVLVYHGSPSGLSVTPARQWTRAGTLFGSAIAAVGDVNGDGFGDVAIGDRQQSSTLLQNNGAAYVWTGGPTGLGEDPSFSTQGATSFQYFGRAADAGDFDGDGYNDVVVDGDRGAMFVYRGGPDAIGLRHSATVQRASGHWRLAPVSGADFNGDGYSDITLTYAEWDTASTQNVGGVTVLWGGPHLLATDRATAVEGTLAEQRLGTSTASGDFDGDGFSDVLVGGYTAVAGVTGVGSAVIYRGGRGGIELAPWAVLFGDTTRAEFGRAVAAADFNGDGVEDAVVAAPRGGARVRAYFGGTTGVATTPAIQVDGADFGADSSKARADFNGDGFDDLVLSGRRADSSGAVVPALLVFYGSAAGLPRDPSVVLFSGALGVTVFGDVAA